MPHRVRAPDDLRACGRLSTCRDLAIELWWTGDHERLSGPGACNGKAMRAIAWHEYKASRGSCPLILLAEAGELAREKIEHLVLTGMHVFMHGQPRRIRRFHHGELAERVIT